MRPFKTLFSASAIAAVILSASMPAAAQQARVFGTIHTPEHQKPMDGSCDIILINPDEDRIAAYPDAEGNWEATVPAGIWTITIRAGISEQFWSSQYLGGAMFPWQAEWFYADSADVGPFNLVTSPGGRLEGQITDPDGHPVEDAEVAVYINDTEIIYLGLSQSTDADGHFSFYGVPAGTFKLAVDAGFQTDEGGQPRPWPFMFAGGSFDVRTAQEYIMTVGSTMELNVQLTTGGVLQVNPKDPNGGTYSLQEDNAIIFPYLVDANGKIMFNINGSSPFESTSVFALVPPGRYTIVGMPLYASIVPGVRAPSIRRTFLGGGYTAEGAQYFDIAAAQVVEQDLNMVESGHNITGLVRAENGDPVQTIVMAVDGDGMPVASSFDFFGTGEYMVKGLDNGDFHLLANLNDLTPMVSTWYPNFGDPTATVGRPAPEQAGTVHVSGDDVINANIIAQTVDGFELSAPPADEIGTVEAFRLNEAYPNPFNARTNIVFNLAASSNATVKLFAVDGRQIATLADGHFAAGLHRVAIDAADLSVGTYLVRLEVAGHSVTKQIVLVK